MDESSFGGECSEPPSVGPEQDDPPGSSGRLSVLTIAEGTASKSQIYNAGKSSVLNLVRNAGPPATPSHQRPANGTPVAEKVSWWVKPAIFAGGILSGILINTFTK